MTTLASQERPPVPAQARSFDKDFVWGAATSAYQIEGAVNVDGRGRSIWDDFCEKSGAIANGESGARACGHYDRWRDDVALMQQLGLGGYRFSIAWPRIFPEGRGKVNEAGLTFYDRLIDALLEAGIKPYPTLYHWDLPGALEAEGGWRVRGTTEAFADYASLVVSRFGDRVSHWTTFNEPYCIADLGHRLGVHAPGRKDDEKTVRQVYHHILLAHGLAVQAIRAAAPNAKTGFVQLVVAPEPLFEDTPHIEAARIHYRRHNAWVLDPLFRGEYPAEEWSALGKNAPDVGATDLEIISQPLDFLGVNGYSSWEYIDANGQVVPVEKNYPRTYMDWPITPDCLYWSCRFTNEEYQPREIYITESGCAYPDEVNAAGEVIDTARIAYLKGHLRALQRASLEGVPLKGYFLWSLLDNFEWAYGYAKRFGIVHVNFETLKRTPKLSARWYSRAIALNRV